MDNSIGLFSNVLTGAEFCEQNGRIIVKINNGRYFFSSVGIHPLYKSGYITESAAEILEEQVGRKGRKMKETISEFLEFAVINYTDDNGDNQSCPTLMPKPQGQVLDWVWSDEEDNHLNSEINPDDRDSDDIEKEICDLVEFFKNRNYTRSSQISDYIKEHNLSSKYPNITGSLEMTNGDETWIFENGILPEYYAEICERLNIGNNGTVSWVTSYESNKSIIKKNNKIS